MPTAIVAYVEACGCARFRGKAENGGVVDLGFYFLRHAWVDVWDACSKLTARQRSGTLRDCE